MPSALTMAISINGLKQVRQTLMNVGGYTEATYQWGRVIAEEAREGIQIATATWRTRPVVNIRVSGGIGTSGWGGRSAEINVEVESPSYTFVDKGTRPHAIYPRGPWPLAFNSIFSAKSRPRRLRAYVGKSAPPKRFAWGVWHPGIQARGFSDLSAARGVREGTKRIIAELQAIIASRGVWGGKMYSGPGWGK